MRVILFFLLNFIYQVVTAQFINSKENHFLVFSKTYGFCKAYHSNVNNCNVNWDSLSVEFLKEFNDNYDSTKFESELLKYIGKAGALNVDFSIPKFSYNDYLLTSDSNWFLHYNLNVNTIKKFDSIWMFFRPKVNCYCARSFSNSSYLKLPFDDPIFNFQLIDSLPTKFERDLAFVKFWNIIEYYNPNFHLIDKNKDSMFIHHYRNIIQANDKKSLYSAFDEAISCLDDAHSEGLTLSYYIDEPTFYHVPNIKVQFMDSSLVVVLSNFSGIEAGSRILKIDNQLVELKLESILKYVSARNDVVRKRFATNYLVSGPLNSYCKLDLITPKGELKTINAIRNMDLYSGFLWSPEYVIGSKSLRASKLLRICSDVNYVNFANIGVNDLFSLSAIFQEDKAVILDLRNSPLCDAIEIHRALFKDPIQYVKYYLPNVRFPGLFVGLNQYTGSNESNFQFTGKVIILVNEYTQSMTEDLVLAFKAQYPQSIIIGQHTAGANGNINVFKLFKDVEYGFTGLSTFDINNRSLYVNGITVDSVVTQSLSSFLRDKDDVVETAMHLLNCNLSTSIVSDGHQLISINPNPVTDMLQINGCENCNFSVIDHLGRQLISNQSSVETEILKLKSGVYYLYCYQNDRIIERIKFVKM